MNFQNPMQMIQEFNKFQRDFKGNPREEVQKLLASGRLTQAQLNQLQAMASQFQGLLNKNQKWL